jgi:hypothetical protein
MSTTIEQHPFQDVETRIIRGERQSLVLTFLIAIMFIVVAAAFLGFTYYKLSDLSAQLTSVRADLESSEKKLTEVNTARQEATAELTRLQTETNVQAREVERLTGQLQNVTATRDQAQMQLDALKSSLAESNQQLKELQDQISGSADLVQYLHPIDLADTKDLYNTSPAPGDLLVRILEFRDRKIPFNFANRPDIGFSSPGFAGYILQSFRKVPDNARPDVALHTLPSVQSPQLGDIIEYETGFALFYLRDRSGSPFVIGMTPTGIAALNLDFHARRIGVLRTNLFAGSR